MTEAQKDKLNGKRYPALLRVKTRNKKKNITEHQQQGGENLSPYHRRVKREGTTHLK